MLLLLIGADAQEGKALTSSEVSFLSHASFPPSTWPTLLQGYCNVIATAFSLPPPFLGVFFFTGVQLPALMKWLPGILSCSKNGCGPVRDPGHASFFSSTGPWPELLPPVRGQPFDPSAFHIFSFFPGHSTRYRPLNPRNTNFSHALALPILLGRTQRCPP